MIESLCIYSESNSRELGQMLRKDTLKYSLFTPFEILVSYVKVAYLLTMIFAVTLTYKIFHKREVLLSIMPSMLTTLLDLVLRIIL